MESFWPYRGLHQVGPLSRLLFICGRELVGYLSRKLYTDVDLYDLCYLWSCNLSNCSKHD